MVFEYATRLSSLLSTTANENDGRGQYPSSAISAESTKDRRIRLPPLPIYSIKLFGHTAGDPLSVSDSGCDFVDFILKVNSNFDLVIQPLTPCHLRTIPYSQSSILYATRSYRYPMTDTPHKCIIARVRCLRCWIVPPYEAM